jgi:3-oxoacyl-[acyl-carrier protein] reductase
MTDLTGRKALVTGAGRGIGAAIARRLAADGADVAITFHRSSAKAEALVDELRAEGHRAFAIAADAADPQAIARSTEEAAAALGGLDILVNNAGIAHVGPLGAMTVEQIEEMLAVNLRAVLLGSRAALPLLPEGGAIISIGSTLAERVFQAGLVGYAASKAALVGFTRALARELGPRGITVNLVQPGNTETDMNPKDSPISERLLSLTALHRYNDAADVAAAVAFLASRDARQITGVTLNVDAGMNA